MRIAQIAPLYESVPPRSYGGTERMVSYLTEELVRQGHEVTLFASGDSVTAANLIPCCPRAVRLDGGCKDPIAPHLYMVEQVYRRADRFDVLHFHVEYLHFPASRRAGSVQITTLHGRLDLPELAPLYREYREMPLISISDSQRRPLPSANWQGTVLHGLPPDLYRLHERPGDYLAFLGRISPEKQADEAIRIALEAGMPLKIAAKVDPNDEAYFESMVRPFLRDPRIEFLGEIGDAEKDEFLGNALALLFPIDWPEPFGIVLIETMACGTPVIAYSRGSVPEIIEDGVTGFIVEDRASAVRAVERARSFDRARCRRVFEERFSAERMARDYVAIFERMIERVPI